jgi:hypothetical protein
VSGVGLIAGIFAGSACSAETEAVCAAVGTAALGFISATAPCGVSIPAEQLEIINVIKMNPFIRIPLFNFRSLFPINIRSFNLMEI